ncbi:type II secretion system protein [Novipirellula sp. SH528]|uniref:type II secretion system protein n=1 Tax=Novipirellula sp. SH528 TaxID=3454466 RepID=UPI003FA01C6E
MTFCKNEPASRQKMTPRRPTSSGFTLVEILVVIVIMGIMGGMIVTAVNGVTRSARHSRTKMIISAIDGVIQEQYDSYKYRPYPIILPNMSRDIPDPGDPMKTITVNYEVLAYEAARVRLIMTRDSQRMELPDKVTDVVQGPIAAPPWPPATLPPAYARNFPASITAVANRVAEDSNGRVIRYFNNSTNPRFQFPATWTPGRKIDTYYDRYRANYSTGKFWSPTNQGAECLYLIMATSFVAGSPAIDAIPSSNIGDTDNDGMLEILDGWGTPLEFIRWPSGYADPTAGIQTTIPDEFDPFRVDFGYTVAGETAPYSLRPLIVSAGSDGEFGMALTAAIDYSTQTWPLTDMDTGDNTAVGNENNGRTGSYVFPDPYLRKAGLSVFPGAITDSTVATDNVTNFALQESQ